MKFDVTRVRNYAIYVFIFYTHTQKMRRPRRNSMHRVEVIDAIDYHLDRMSKAAYMKFFYYNQHRKKRGLNRHDIGQYERNVGMERIPRSNPFWFYDRKLEEHSAALEHYYNVIDAMPPV